MTPLSEAHDTKFEIGGDVYWVRRTFDLIRRIEQAYGPLAELDVKLRSHRLTADAIVELTSIALADQASRPPADVIRDHVFEVGIRESADQVSLLVLHLFAGHKRAVKWLDDEARKENEGASPASGDPSLAA